MGEFWKNEWDLFKDDLSSVARFLTQPVVITFGNEDPLMLRPTAEEAMGKSSTSSFWKNEWDLFTKEYDSFLNYISQPVKFK